MDQWTPSLERTVVEPLGHAISGALEHDEFVLMFQPFINVGTGLPQGYEALIRWGRPGEPVAGPASFLPSAQGTDLICEIDAWVLRAALAYLAGWQSQGMSERFLSINLGGRHITQPRVVGDVQLALTAHQVEPESLLVEVAETVLSDDPGSRRHLEALRRLGVAVCLDDFGTGASSTAQLASLPIDIVKIDGSYLDLSSDDARRHVRSLVRAPQELGLPVVMEGVESRAQLDFIRDLGCEWAQGFHLAMPMPPTEVQAWEVRSLAG